MPELKVIRDFKEIVSKYKWNLTYSGGLRTADNYNLCPLAAICRSKYNRKVENTPTANFEGILGITPMLCTILVTAADNSILGLESSIVLTKQQADYLGHKKANIKTLKNAKIMRNKLAEIIEANRVP